MKRKWITKAEISNILKIYSIRKNEFQPIQESEYFFESQIIKGYTIKISQETIDAPDYSSKTGRIIVSHTQSNGKKTYTDIWIHDQNGNLQFCFRNLWNQPLADVDYIKELEEKNKHLLQSAQKLQEQISVKQNSSHKLITDTDAEAEIKYLRQQINNLKEKNQKLINDTKVHNVRGAGRKPSQERLNAIDQVKVLLESGCSDQDIMAKLKISRATYYRYKKSVKN